MLSYHYTLIHDDNDTLPIQFPDVPEAVAVAESADDAPQQAAEGLEAALQLYVDARRPLPATAHTTGHCVRLSASVTAKLLLSEQMVLQGIRKAELARMLNIHPPQVDRLLNLGHSSKMESIETALEALGHRLEIALA